MVRTGLLRKLFGDAGERAAVRYLKASGLKVLARQSRDRIGEIDVIALDGECIVFVEVKTRRTDARGRPAEAVTAVKQRQLTRAALAWLKRRQLLDRPTRFDVVAILWAENGQPVIEHIRSAFEACGTDGMYS